MADGTKVGDAYVEVSADLDRRAFESAADRAGDVFNRGFSDKLSSWKPPRFDTTVLSRDASTAGGNFGEAFQRELNNKIQNIEIGAAKTRLTKNFIELGGEVAVGFGKEVADFAKHLPADMLVKAAMTPFGTKLIVAGIPILVGVGITLGAALGGGILTGLGGIAFGGALAVAINNPQVKAQFAEFGEFASAQIGRASMVLRKELIGSIGLLKEAFMQIDFEGFFTRVAPAVGIFASKIRELAPALNEVLQKIAFMARPFADFATEFASKLIPAIDRFMDKTASSLPGLMSALTFVGNIFLSLIDLAGNAFQHWGRLFGGFVQWMAPVIDAFGDMIDAMGPLVQLSGLTGDKFHDMADQMRGSLVVGEEFKLVSQDIALNGLGIMGTKAEEATRRINDLKNALEQFNAVGIESNELNERWEQNWDDLTLSIQRHGMTLDEDSEAGRRNRDALQDAIITSRDKIAVDIEEGVSMQEATRRHYERMDALIQEKFKTKETKDEALILIETYGKVPTQVLTNIIVTGMTGVLDSLNNLRIKQISLEKAIPRAKAAEQFYNEEKGKAAGGLIRGPGTSTSDSIMVPLSNGEYVVQASAVRQLGLPFLNKVNQGMLGDGKGAGYSTNFPFRVDASKAKADPEWASVNNPNMLGIISGLKGALGPFVGGNPLGGWAGMWNWIRQQVPGITLNSGYRPGSRVGSGYDYHHYGRAIDIGNGYDVMRMNRVANAITSAFGNRTLEMIYTPIGSRQIWNGRYHTFSSDVAAGHYDHLHWAMDQGGGLMPGTSMVQNQTGRPETVLNPRHSALVGRILSGEALVVENYLTIEIDGQFVTARILQSEQRLAEALRNGEGNR